MSASDTYRSVEGEVIDVDAGPRMVGAKESGHAVAPVSWRARA